MAGRKSTLDKNLVIELYKDGHTYRAIAEKLSSTEDAVRKLIKRNTSKKELNLNKAARQEMKKQTLRKEKLKNTNEIDFIVEHRSELGSAALKEIREASKYGINSNESMSDYSFVKWNRDCYVTDRATGILHFDKKRIGGATKNLLRRYVPIIIK